MNLTDKEILELTELCNALMDGTLTEAQKAQLSEKLAFSEAARQFYVRFTGLSARADTSLRPRHLTGRSISFAV